MMILGCVGCLGFVWCDVGVIGVGVGYCVCVDGCVVCGVVVDFVC